MKTLKYYLYAVVALFIYVPLMAQKQVPPPGGKPHDFKLPQKINNELPNGMRSTLVQYGNVPKATFNLIIKTGNAHENKNEVWLADLMGQMMEQGSKTMDFKTIAKKVAGMGGQLSISVGPDETSISGSVLSEYAADFTKLLGDLVMNPAFPESELARLKSDMKRNLTVQQSVPQSQANARFYKAIYGDQPYGNYFPTTEMIDSYTLPMIKDFYNENVGAKRSVLYVAGKFNATALQSTIKTVFGKWKAGKEVSYPEETATAKAETIIIDRKNAPQTTILLGLPTITPADDDYIAATVANAIIGGSFMSRITSNIRENKGYTYSPSSSLSSRRNGSLWMQSADVTAAHTIDALNEIKKEIAKLQQEPPSKEELEGIQNFRAGVFVLQNSSPFGIISQLNFLDKFKLPDSYLTNFVANTYKVTPEKVSAIARSSYQVDKMTLVMVGDKESIEKQQAEK